MNWSIELDQKTNKRTNKKRSQRSERITGTLLSVTMMKPAIDYDMTEIYRMNSHGIEVKS